MKGFKTFNEFTTKRLLSDNEYEELFEIINNHYSDFSLTEKNDYIILKSNEHIDWMSGNWDKVSKQLDDIEFIKIGTDFKSAKNFLLRKLKLERILDESDDN